MLKQGSRNNYKKVYRFLTQGGFPADDFYQKFLPEPFHYIPYCHRMEGMTGKEGKSSL